MTRCSLHRSEVVAPGNDKPWKLLFLPVWLALSVARHSDWVHVSIAYSFPCLVSFGPSSHPLHRKKWSAYPSWWVVCVPSLVRYHNDDVRMTVLTILSTLSAVESVKFLFVPRPRSLSNSLASCNVMVSFPIILIRPRSDITTVGASESHAMIVLTLRDIKQFVSINQYSALLDIIPMHVHKRDDMLSCFFLFIVDTD